LIYDAWLEKIKSSGMFGSHSDQMEKWLVDKDNIPELLDALNLSEHIRVDKGDDINGYLAEAVAGFGKGE